MKLANPDKNSLKKIKRLYREAFPRIERKPFFFIKNQIKKGEAELFSIETDKGKFAGLAFIVRYGDLAMLDYFAIHPSVRGKGIGSEVIRLLMERYSESRFILEIESVDEPCENLAARKKRRAFYLRNGMKPAGFTAHVFYTDLEVLTSGKPVSFEEYRALYSAHIGRRAERRITLK